MAAPSRRRPGRPESVAQAGRARTNGRSRAGRPESRFAVRSSVTRALRPRVKRWRPSAQHARGQVRRRRGWTGATWLSATRSMSSAGAAGSGRRDEPRRGSRSARVARSVATRWFGRRRAHRSSFAGDPRRPRPRRSRRFCWPSQARRRSWLRADIPAPACAPPSHVPRGVTRIEAEVARGHEGRDPKASKGDAIEQPSGTHRPPRLSETATTSFERRAGARRRIRRREAKRCVPPPRCASPSLCSGPASSGLALVVAVATGARVRV